MSVRNMWEFLVAERDLGFRQHETVTRRRNIDFIGLAQSGDLFCWLLVNHGARR